MLMSWFDFRWQPRNRSQHLTRHIPGAFNELCDDLARRGRIFRRENRQHLVVHLLDIPLRFVMGMSDGSYNPGDEHVGLGWCILAADDFNMYGVPKWQVWIEVFARAHGCSSTYVELSAHHCVVTIVDHIIK